jgi:hypothetical protein
MMLVTELKILSGYKKIRKIFLHLGKEQVKHITLSCSDKIKWLAMKKGVTYKQILRCNNNAFVTDLAKYVDN